MKREANKIIKQRGDPLGVRTSSLEVLKNSKHVTLNLNQIDELSETVKKVISRLEKINRIEFGEHKNSVQKIFILNCLNFFLAGK